MGLSLLDIRKTTLNFSIFRSYHMIRIIKTFLFFSFLFTCPVLFAQNTIEIGKAKKILSERGELYLSFENPGKKILSKLSKQLSIDKITEKTIVANANAKEFELFLKSGIDFQVYYPHKGFVQKKSAKNLKGLYDWDTYPTYEQYLSLMQKFAENYPSLCLIDTIGESVEGRQILVLKISDNVETQEDEPKIFYTSTMHGDETGGYVLMLRLIDYLLSNYGTNAQTTRLVDNLEIWINPNSNPDGTYAGGNHTLAYATRRNANHVDLNRNFPDPKGGEHPDGNDYQKENIAMMEFMDKHRFTMSANFHAGVEVVNYPWDTFREKHPDVAWYKMISNAYADTAHAVNASYMTPWFAPTGVTNGFEWYSLQGGRQDYVNYFLRGREITIELDERKISYESHLHNLWDYNHKSMLNYMEECLFGIRGKITDAETGEPIYAQIEITGHDKKNSQILSSRITGMYYRMIAEGNYSLKFTAEGYEDAMVENVSVKNRESTALDITMSKLPAGLAENKKRLTQALFYPNPFERKINVDIYLTKKSDLYIKITNIAGKTVKIKHFQNIEQGKHKLNIETDFLDKGIYFCSVFLNKQRISKKMIKL